MRKFEFEKIVRFQPIKSILTEILYKTVLENCEFFNQMCDDSLNVFKKIIKILQNKIDIEIDLQQNCASQSVAVIIKLKRVMRGRNKIIKK